MNETEKRFGIKITKVDGFHIGFTIAHDKWLEEDYIGFYLGKYDIWIGFMEFELKNQS